MRGHTRPGRRSRALQGAAIGAAGLAVVLAAGCTKKLEPGSAANSIKEKVNAQLADTGVSITSVTCPDSVEAKQGVTFTCTINVSNGSSIKVKGTQTDDNGTFNIELEDPGALAGGSAGASTTTSGG